MIEPLTKEQELLLPAIRDEWIGVGLSTAPANRAEAERGVALAYKAAGLTPPGLIIWLDSPVAGAIGACLLAQVRDQVRAQVWDQVGAQVRDQVRAQVWDQVGAQVWDQVGAQVWDQVVAQVRAQVSAQVRAQVRAQVSAQVWTQVRAQVSAQVSAQVWDQVRDQVSAQVWTQVRAQVWDQVRAQVIYGQHDAGWLSQFDFFKRLNLDCGNRLEGLSIVARNAGWWWPFTDAVILTERPTELHRNSDGKLHSLSEPAILYPDGFGVWMKDGVRVEEPNPLERLSAIP